MARPSKRIDPPVDTHLPVQKRTRLAVDATDSTVDVGSDPESLDIRPSVSRKDDFFVDEGESDHLQGDKLNLLDYSKRGFVLFCDSNHWWERPR